MNKYAIRFIFWTRENKEGREIRMVSGDDWNEAIHALKKELAKDEHIYWEWSVTEVFEESIDWSPL
jgi:hypothetical protein